MLAIIQGIASKSYTFREVAAYVTISVCMSFAVGFLLAAFTRIFKERSEGRTTGMDQGAAWAIAYMARYESKQVAERMAREWGFKTLESLKDIDEYDAEMIRPFIQS